MADPRRSRPPLPPAGGSPPSRSPVKRSPYPEPEEAAPPQVRDASVGGGTTSATSVEDASTVLESLAGVPDPLRAWWHRTQPGAFDQETYDTGRIDVLKRIAQMLGPEDLVVDLGCGTGLLAKVSGRRDIAGVEMSEGMLKAARRSMEEVVQENILEYHPLELVDVVVLNNVLEPYARDVRALIFEHCRDFLRPGGKVIVGIALGTGSSVDSLAFPTAAAGADAATPEGIEDELSLAGFETDCPELLSVVQPSLGLSLGRGDSQSDLSQVKRRSFMLLVGRKPSA